MAFIKSAKQFLKSVLDKVLGRIAPQERFIAERFFDKKRKEIINQIIAHPISQELKNHTAPSPTLGTPGSLFGFLGLNSGSHPVDDIIHVVESRMTYKVSKKIFRKGLGIEIKFPSLADFANEPNLIIPWEGGLSVPEAIEVGLSGLGFYIRATDARSRKISRSGDGLQAQNQIRQTIAPRTPYLTQIFAAQREETKNFRL